MMRWLHRLIGQKHRVRRLTRALPFVTEDRLILAQRAAEAALLRRGEKELLKSEVTMLLKGVEK